MLFKICRYLELDRYTFPLTVSGKFSRSFPHTVGTKLNRIPNNSFSCGFYSALAKDESPAVAFDAGRAQMSLSGFCEGDPDDYLHPAGHEHLRAPRRRDCPGCNPPVHGEVVLVGGGR